MICPSCATLNPESATTCSVCATPLSGREAAGAADALPPGTMLQDGALVIQQVLGQGGFGITYAGYDTRLKRPVAIKEFFPYGAKREGLTAQPPGVMAADDYSAARGRFLDEAQVLAQFRHGGIVAVYALFEEHNTAYMVMELLRGQTLLQRLEARGVMPEAEAIEYIRQAALALAEVHQGGLLHRDIKPENIFVTETGRVALIDFGTAREYAVGKTRRMTVTLTPGYAPLEQYAQRAQRGPYTDIYALAATLYHLVTGEAPVPATDRAAGVELLDARELNGEVSSAVAQVIGEGLAMEIAKRPQSAPEFLSRLLNPHDATLPNMEFANSGAPPQASNLKRRPARQLPDASFMTLRSGDHKISAVTFGPKGRMLASGNDKGTISLWEPDSGVALKTLSGHNRRVNALAFSPDGTLLASGGYDGEIRLYEPWTGKWIRSLHWSLLESFLGSNYWITALAFSPNSKLIACGTGSSRAAGFHKAGHAVIWEAATGRMLHTLSGHHSWVNAIAFAPDGHRIALASMDTAVKLWDVPTGHVVNSLEGHQGSVVSVAFTPDGQILATAGEDTTIKLWLVAHGACRLTLTGHDAGVTSVAFSLHGTLLASGGHDRTVRLWDTHSGLLQRTLDEHTDGVTAVAFSPDGRTLVSASADTTIKLWHI